MELIKSLTLTVCCVSLAFSLLAKIIQFEKYSKMIKAIFASVMILTTYNLIHSADIDSVTMFPSDEEYTYDTFEANILIDEAVKLQTKQRLIDSASQLLTEYGIEFSEISLDVNIDESNCITISNISLISDSPLTAQYALKKLFGDNADIEVLDYE